MRRSDEEIGRELRETVSKLNSLRKEADLAGLDVSLYSGTEGLYTSRRYIDRLDAIFCKVSRTTTHTF